MVDSGDSVTGKAIRILHVDDDLLFLETSRLILLDMAKNLVIDFACSVNEGFVKLAKKDYDVIVVDYEMPQKNGLDFLKELRLQKRDIPVVLFTGKGREEIAVKALNLGADGYYNKQGNPETVYGELIHGIQKAIELSKAKRDILESEDKFSKAFKNVHMLCFNPFKRWKNR